MTFARSRNCPEACPKVKNSRTSPCAIEGGRRFEAQAAGAVDAEVEVGELDGAGQALLEWAGEGLAVELVGFDDVAHTAVVAEELVLIHVEFERIVVAWISVPVLESTLRPVPVSLVKTLSLKL